MPPTTQRLRAGGLSPPPSFQGLTAPCSETARRGSDAGIAQQPQGVVRALPLGPAAPLCGGEWPVPPRHPGVSPPSPRHPPQRPHQRPRPRSEQRETHRRFHSLVLWPWRNMRISKRLDCLKSIFSFVSQYMKKEKKVSRALKITDYICLCSNVRKHGCLKMAAPQRIRQGAPEGGPGRLRPGARAHRPQGGAGLLIGPRESSAPGMPGWTWTEDLRAEPRDPPAEAVSHAPAPRCGTGSEGGLDSFWGHWA